MSLLYDDFLHGEVWSFNPKVSNNSSKKKQHESRLKVSHENAGPFSWGPCSEPQAAPVQPVKMFGAQQDLTNLRPRGLYIGACVWVFKFNGYIANAAYTGTIYLLNFK
ncbi:MAG: hypothetical protein Q4A06_07800, partial [Cardiobacteriaceae bacterium]|nr:hypothetical protein [Cardiobacteriaceae bacterium]